jgi:hypothetical protein
MMRRLYVLVEIISSLLFYRSGNNCVDKSSMRTELKRLEVSNSMYLLRIYNYFDGIVFAQADYRYIRPQSHASFIRLLLAIEWSVKVD